MDKSGFNCRLKKLEKQFTRNLVHLYFSFAAARVIAQITFEYKCLLAFLI